MGEYLLSIDNGLTTTKAVIYALDGREIASSVTDTIVENTGDQAELDMELQWRNTILVIQDVIRKVGIASADILGIGNSGHGAGVYLLDRSGIPVRRAISSMDGRAADIIEEWRQQGISNYAQTYQNMWIGQPIPLLSWLKRNEPENYQKTATILMAKDWIRYQLTGQLALDYTDASNSGLVNLATHGYDLDIYRPYGVADINGKLPELIKSTAIAGYVTAGAAAATGLKAGTPIIGGLFDVVACSLGSGIYDNQRYSITAGTWNINSGVEERIFPSLDIMEWVYYADNRKYICIDSSATSAVNLEWFVKNIATGLNPGGIKEQNILPEVDRALARFQPDDIDLLYLPFIYKSKLTQKTEGCFFGLKASHDVYHLLRAVYEGVVFAHLKHVENLQKAGIVKKIASLSGGASKSDIWCQMFADILNLEIVTTEASQVGALGSAICASVALGVYDSFADAVLKMVREKRRYQPGGNIAAYRQKYQRFNEIIRFFDRDL